MSNSYRRPDYAPITTGLEEFSAVRGLADQRLETISEADRLLVGEASSSIPNATAYEILCGINHVRVATGNVQTFIFPAAPIGVCVEGTSMRPTIVQQYYNEPKPANNKNNKREQTPLIIDAAQLDAGSVKFGANPLERLRNMVRRAIEKEYENGGRDKTQHLAETLGVVNATNLPSELATLAPQG